MKHFIDCAIKVRKLEDLIILPEVVLVNAFNEDSAKAFRENVAKAASNPNNIGIIPIVIDSYGGHVYSLLSMLDCVAELKREYKVVTIATGKAMSCGSILLCSGSEGYRYVAKHSTVMVHEVGMGSHGKIEEVKADANEGDRLNKLIFSIASESIGKPASYLTDLVHEHNHADWFLNSDECLKHNIANHIGYPMFDIDVSVNIKFK
jgi:ATP-dependent protease ClpP protease subunit